MACRAGWFVSHAMTPFADPRDEGVFRVYFGGRDANGRSQIGSFDLIFDPLPRTTEPTFAPYLGLGPLGAFDDSGVSSTWIVNHLDVKYHYFTGWSLGVSVPFCFFIGLATSEDNGQTFVRVSRSPILERNEVDPYLTGSPCVLVERDIWKMWYVSGVRWEATSDGVKHYYHIKYAESSNGIQWHRAGQVCIDFKGPDEYAIARPCVVKDNGVYKMWYAYRGDRYRIGYAESHDGLSWTRVDDRAGISVSRSGWDAEMIEYAHVFDHAGCRYMLYNGNDYGRTGIGLAVLEVDQPFSS
jgi:hypothetical protein